MHCSPLFRSGCSKSKKLKVLQNQDEETCSMPKLFMLAVVGGEFDGLLK